MFISGGPLQKILFEHFMGTRYFITLKELRAGRLLNGMDSQPGFGFLNREICKEKEEDRNILELQDASIILIFHLAGCMHYLYIHSVFYQKHFHLGENRKQYYE